MVTIQCKNAARAAVAPPDRIPCPARTGSVALNRVQAAGTGSMQHSPGPVFRVYNFVRDRTVNPKTQSTVALSRVQAAGGRFINAAQSWPGISVKSRITVNWY